MLNILIKSLQLLSRVHRSALIIAIHIAAISGLKALLYFLGVTRPEISSWLLRGPDMAMRLGV